MIEHLASANHVDGGDDIFRANRDIYNLITIFLTSKEIAEVLRLVSIGDDDIFEDELRAYDGRFGTRFHFHIVGAVGAGKTTLIRNLRSFATYEEWTGPVPQVMYKDKALLTPSDKKEIDAFLRVQMKKKNLIMKSAPPGFHVMDRAYLDLFAFSDNDAENKPKAKMLSEHVGTAGFQDGHILYLKADEDTLEERQWARGHIPKGLGGQGWSRETLVKQQELLRLIYKPSKVYCTKTLGAAELARSVAIDVLTGAYEDCEFQNRIDWVKSGRLASHY